MGSLLTPQAGPRVDNPADAASQSPSVSEPGGARTSNKRRPEDEESGPKQQRSKRNRVSVPLTPIPLYSTVLTMTSSTYP